MASTLRPVRTAGRSRSATPLLKGIMAIATVMLVVAGCASSTGAGWTFAPASASPAPAGSPGTSPSPSPSGAASPDASGSPAASASASAPAASGSPSPSASDASYTFVKKEACPESRFECVTLSVPKDHFAAGGGPSWDVTFAIQRAAKERRGTFVVITGGPGSSGISSADSYTDYYAAGVTDAYDIVFMDQRGIGLSGPIQCIDAAAAYYASPARPQEPAERDAAAAAAQTFVTDCLTEAGVTEADLPLYATTQAVEDLEAVRDYLAVDKLDLYGESYGTQFVQYYATAHPDRIAALYLDGPVDLTIDGMTYYVEAARSAEDTLVETLNACSADATCKTDVKGGDALAVYDDLADRLRGAPMPFDFPTAAGTTIRRELTIADLENAAFGYIYSPGDRFMLQRAIAAASNANYVPLARLAYDSIGIDPETLAAEEDPTWSDALYFAVECQDYAFLPGAGDPDARLDAWIARAETDHINGTRLETSFYGDVPCLYWPTATTSDQRPAPIQDPPYPTFVMTATTDPATPIANAMRIFSRLDDAYFIQAIGGPHVIYAWGEACPDDTVTAYLVDRTLPTTRVTTCIWSVADPYVATAPTAASSYKDALALMRSVDDQILNTDDYYSRLDTDPLAIGCDFGGTLTYTPGDTGTAVKLDACAFTQDVPLTGTGATDDDAGTFELDATSGDDTLHYERDADGGTSVKGTFDGKTVDLKEAA